MMKMMMQIQRRRQLKQLRRRFLNGFKLMRIRLFGWDQRKRFQMMIIRSSTKHWVRIQEKIHSIGFTLRLKVKLSLLHWFIFQRELQVICLITIMANKQLILSCMLEECWSVRNSKTFSQDILVSWEVLLILMNCHWMLIEKHYNN